MGLRRAHRGLGGQHGGEVSLGHHGDRRQRAGGFAPQATGQREQARLTGPVAHVARRVVDRLAPGNRMQLRLARAAAVVAAPDDGQRSEY